MLISEMFFQTFVCSATAPQIGRLLPKSAWWCSFIYGSSGAVFVSSRDSFVISTTCLYFSHQGENAVSKVAGHQLVTINSCRSPGWSCGSTFRVGTGLAGYSTGCYISELFFTVSLLLVAYGFCTSQLDPLLTYSFFLLFVSGFEKRGNFVHFPKFQL